MDKRKQREQRKREEARQQRKEQHAKNRSNNAAIHPDEIVPLEIDGSVNLYDVLKDGLVGGGLIPDAIKNAMNFRGLPIEKFIKNVDRTLEHFKVPLENRSGTGNVLIRFGLLYNQQPEGKVFQIDSDDPTLNYIADLWEYFNRLDW